MINPSLHKVSKSTNERSDNKISIKSPAIISSINGQEDGLLGYDFDFHEE